MAHLSPHRARRRLLFAALWLPGEAWLWFSGWNTAKSWMTHLLGTRRDLWAAQAAAEAGKRSGGGAGALLGTIVGSVVVSSVGAWYWLTQASVVFQRVVLTVGWRSLAFMTIVASILLLIKLLRPTDRAHRLSSNLVERAGPHQVRAVRRSVAGVRRASGDRRRAVRAADRPHVSRHDSGGGRDAQVLPAGPATTRPPLVQRCRNATRLSATHSLAGNSTPGTGMETVQDQGSGDAGRSCRTVNSRPACGAGGGSTGASVGQQRRPPPARTQGRRRQPAPPAATPLPPPSARDLLNSSTAPAGCLPARPWSRSIRRPVDDLPRQVGSIASQRAEGHVREGEAVHTGRRHLLEQHPHQRRRDGLLQSGHGRGSAQPLAPCGTSRSGRYVTPAAWPDEALHAVGHTQEDRWPGSAPSTSPLRRSRHTSRGPPTSTPTPSPGRRPRL